jgi:hypothetical protein
MCVVTWHDCTWYRWRVFVSTPHPSTRSCTKRALWPTWDWYGEASNDEHVRYILYLGMIPCSALTALDRRGAMVSPSAEPCMHATICPHNHQYSIIIQIKFQTYTYFEIIINGNFLRLMFVYTTSNIYLTPRFKFWNLLVKFLWNC